MRRGSFKRVGWFIVAAAFLTMPTASVLAIQEKHWRRQPESRTRNCRAGYTRKTRLYRTWNPGPGVITQSKIRAGRKAERQRRGK